MRCHRWQRRSPRPHHAPVGELKGRLMLTMTSLGAAGTRSEEHTSELQSLMRISYAVFCLKKQKPYTDRTHTILMNLQSHTINHYTPHKVCYEHYIRSHHNWRVTNTC